MQNLPVPGKTKPTEWQVRRAQDGPGEDWRFPEKRYEKGKDRPGTIICPRCHAISVQKRWFVDESLYQQLRHTPGVRWALCPGDRRLKLGYVQGEVILRSPLLLDRHGEALNKIHNTEREAWLENPIARVASIELDGDHIRVLTTTRWLAQRIGKEFAKAFGGHLRIDNLLHEHASRVYWTREH